MGYFKAEGGSANGVLISSQVLIGAAVGFLTTQLHDGSARIMPAMMLASTPVRHHAAVCPIAARVAGQSPAVSGKAT